jgi:hypothetical protein
LLLNEGRPVLLGPTERIGIDRNENVFEIACGCTRDELSICLEQIGEVFIEEYGGYFVIREPLAISSQTILTELTSHGLQIGQFRDISKSIKLLFEQTAEER